MGKSTSGACHAWLLILGNDEISRAQVERPYVKLTVDVIFGQLTMGVPRTVSVIKSDDCNFILSVYLTPLRGFPFSLEFCYGSGLEKTRMMPLSDDQKNFVDMLIYLETVRQTDRWTDGLVITISRCA